jgi:hypothetical protein
MTVKVMHGRECDHGQQVKSQYGELLKRSEWCNKDKNYYERQVTHVIGHVRANKTIPLIRRPPLDTTLTVSQLLPPAGSRPVSKDTSYSYLLTTLWVFKLATFQKGSRNKITIAFLIVDMGATCPAHPSSIGAGLAQAV